MRKLVLGFLLASLVACGGDDGGGGDEVSGGETSDTTTAPAGDSPPLCADVYAEGAPVDEAQRLEDELIGCVDETGAVAFFGFAFEDCLDGRRLQWNDEGWGYAGDVWHRHEPGVELVAPATERTACTG